MQTDTIPIARSVYNFSYVSDPSPTETDSPTEIVLHKELSAYPKTMEQPTMLSDSYIRQAATWDFTYQSSIDPATIRSAFIRVSTVADDHGSGIANYNLASWTNGLGILSGPAMSRTVFTHHRN